MPLVFVLYALFASVFTIAKVGLEYSSPLFLIGSRMTLAGLLMLGYQFLFAKQRFQIRKVHLKRIILLAAINIYLTNAFEFWGLRYLTSFKTCFIYSLSPFLSALFSYLVFSETMTLKKGLGLLVGFVGFIPVLVTEGAAEQEAFHFGLLSWPEISVMLAAVCSVYGWIILRQLVKEDGFPSMMANGLSMFLGGCMALVHSLMTENWSPIPVTEFLPFFECAVLLIVISNFVAYNLYGYLLKRFTATFISFAGWTTPLFTALFGWVLLGERITWPFLVSAAIIFVGLLVFYYEELRQGYILREAKTSEA